MSKWKLILASGGVVVWFLMQVWPKVKDSNYYVVTDNFFTTPLLLRPKEEKISGVGNVRANRMEDASTIVREEYWTLYLVDFYLYRNFLK